MGRIRPTASQRVNLLGPQVYHLSFKFILYPINNDAKVLQYKDEFFFDSCEAAT